MFARARVEIPRSTFCRWVLRTADILEPLYQLMIERIYSSEPGHTDDTPVPVPDLTLPQNRTARLWVYCSNWQNTHKVCD